MLFLVLTSINRNFHGALLTLRDNNAKLSYLAADLSTLNLT
jgi:hypothetical protein